VQVKHAIFTDVDRVKHVLHDKVGRAVLMGNLVNLGDERVEIRERESPLLRGIKLQKMKTIDELTNLNASLALVMCRLISYLKRAILVAVRCWRRSSRGVVLNLLINST